MIGLSAVVLAIGAVTPQAFAGSLPGLGRLGGARSGGGAAVPGGPLGRLRDNNALGRARGGGALGGLGRARGGGALGGARGGGALGGLGGAAGAGAGNDGSCSDVELVFARGTGEPQGLGIVGGPLARSLAAELPDQDVGSFAVEYAAAASQASAGPGATNMSQHITAVAEQCPDTRFVIGGYSQGASVTDIAMGIRAGTPGEAIPDELAPRVAAVVVFGNPLNARGRTIEESSAEFGPKAKEFCADGDPVCGGGGNFAAHLSYPRNGDVQEAAEFAAGKINGS